MNALSIMRRNTLIDIISVAFINIFTNQFATIFLHICKSICYNRLVYRITNRIETIGALIL